VNFSLRLLCAALTALLALSARAQVTEHKIPPGYQPEEMADEKGLWLEVREYEKAIQQSPLLVKSPDINNYVSAVTCRVAAAYCRDFRVYVVRNPGFNASMTPNGMMQIWTGLLLRTQSTDELAAVIGHEIAHYTRLHTLERMREARRKTTSGSVFDIGVLILTGVNVPVGQMTALLSLLAYSRDQESEADFLGVKLVADAQYDPHASYRVWRQLISEEEAAEVKRTEPGVFTQTHPDASVRANELEAWVTSTYGRPDVEMVSDADHVEWLNRNYLLLMDDQIKTHRFGRTGELLQRHAAIGIEPSLVRYFYGEMFRQRGNEGDLKRALDAYLHSIEGGTAPPAAYKNAGYLYLKADDIERARRYFRQYLELDPEADDRAMIEFYLEE
jgi:predicted Zn-dependent protease